MEMGVVSLPPFPRLNDADAVRNYRLSLYIERVGAATTIQGDCFILVPYTHRFTIDECSINVNASNNCWIYLWEDDSYATYNESTDAIPNLSIQFSTNDFVRPIAGGNIVICSQQSTISNIGDALTYTVGYYERFRTHGE
jgi:hypothetical protein